MSDGLSVFGGNFYMPDKVYGPVTVDLGGVPRDKVASMRVVSRQLRMPGAPFR